MIPIVLLPTAQADLKAVPAELRPAVLEHLSRTSAGYRTCSRETCLPHPPGGRLSGLWCRRPDGRATMIEVHFRVETNPDRLAVKRVILIEVGALPYYAVNPIEFHPDASAGWPVVDV